MRAGNPTAGLYPTSQRVKLSIYFKTLNSANRRAFICCEVLAFPSTIQDGARNLVSLGYLGYLASVQQLESVFRHEETYIWELLPTYTFLPVKIVVWHVDRQRHRHVMGTRLDLSSGKGLPLAVRNNRFWSGSKHTHTHTH